MLRDILPATKAKMKILNTIYNNRDINIRNIIKLSRTSPNLTVDYINQLEKYKIITIRNLGGTKKTYIKSVSFNFKAPLSDIFFRIIEINKKEELIKRYKVLRPFVKQIEDVVSNNMVVLVYGSYARFQADKESDLDLWLIGKLDAKLRKDIEEILVTLPIEYSVTVETKKEFLKKISDPIHQNILRGRVIIANEKRFFDIMRLL